MFSEICVVSKKFSHVASFVHLVESEQFFDAFKVGNSRMPFEFESHPRGDPKSPLGWLKNKVFILKRVSICVKMIDGRCFLNKVTFWSLVDCQPPKTPKRHMKRLSETNNFIFWVDSGLTSESLRGHPGVTLDYPGVTPESTPISLVFQDERE